MKGSAIPNVVQVQRLFGEPDYLLRVVAADLAAYPAAGGSRPLMIGLWVAAVGDMGAYWIDGLGSQIFATVEFLALPVIVGGAVRCGYVLVRRGPRPRWVGWVMLASAAAVPASLALTNYWPHGVLLPVSFGIAVLSLVAAGSES